MIIICTVWRRLPNSEPAINVTIKKNNNKKKEKKKTKQTNLDRCFGVVYRLRCGEQTERASLRVSQIAIRVSLDSNLCVD